ncbi:gamma-glutamylcyclotransferase family protein [Tropicibacter alexandrii]|uniref:gamma-glutamylcyclotransferase family protein n=1 Tax=Tropicibacter alexandrii TaxID=2267683 RepID=UPI000EF4C77B|nr:gamma-glutamylcyclotransferase family protein [Tropicibacter alexandrii]
MTNAYFFGYGSLVNRLTHGYTPTRPARLKGWRRAWRAVPERDLCFLTAVPAPGEEILGLIAPVPAEGWATLDLREAAYERLDGTDAVLHDSDAAQIAVYAIAPGRVSVPGPQNPILLSYLDVVIQGYLTEYGAEGARHFLDTTDGWDAPILNDRAAPRYPRAQSLTEEERATVDAALRDFGSRVLA